jgi:hypothetical protein
VLLGVEADHVGGDVDDLLADTVRTVSIHISRIPAEWLHTGCGAA